MGKGDKKSKKGKQALGSFGNSRRKREASKEVAAKAPKAKAAAKKK